MRRLSRGMDDPLNGVELRGVTESIRVGQVRLKDEVVTARSELLICGVELPQVGDQARARTLIGRSAREREQSRAVTGAKRRNGDRTANEAGGAGDKKGSMFFQSPGGLAAKAGGSVHARRRHKNSLFALRPSRAMEEGNDLSEFLRTKQSTLAGLQIIRK